jgi:hypothetical protein
MYEPVHIRRRPTRRGVRAVLVLIAVAFIALVVTVVRTMPHRSPAAPLTLDQLGMIIPDAAQTQLVAAMVKTRIAQPHAAPGGAATGSACSASSTPHKWNSTQRENAKTIVQVGVALGVPKRGEIVALATAMQESHLVNLGYLGANNDHDSLGLFQQRPSMGWGTVAQVTDPVFSATAFYLALQSVPRWSSMSVTDAAQSVQRSGAPYAYAQWETDATVLTQVILCSSL